MLLLGAVTALVLRWWRYRTDTGWLRTTVSTVLIPIIRNNWDRDQSQLFRIIRFFFENRLHWQFKVTVILCYIFIYVQMKHKYIIAYMYLTVGNSLSNLGTPSAGYKSLGRAQKPAFVFSRPSPQFCGIVLRLPRAHTTTWPRVGNVS
jgi:hypothetical protein